MICGEPVFAPAAQPPSGGRLPMNSVLAGRHPLGPAAVVDHQLPAARRRLIGVRLRLEEVGRLDLHFGHFGRLLGLQGQLAAARCPA